MGVGPGAAAPLRPLVGAGLVLFLAIVVGIAIVAAILGTATSSCAPPRAVGPVVDVPAPGTAGRVLRGRVSWFGGPRDSTTGSTTASGAPVTRPGIAVYNTETLGGYWWVRFPNGRADVLQQTDIGPAPWTGRVLDVVYSALPRIGYTERNFPTDSQIEARYLGKSKRWQAAAGAAPARSMPAGAVPDDSAGCQPGGLTDTGIPGKVRVAPGANRAGVGLAAITLQFVARVAGIAGVEIVVSTGTAHSQYTTSGGVSDHWDGHAVDIGMAANNSTDDSPLGDRIMAACLVAGGVQPDRAMRLARAGGLFTLNHGGLRIQCIWRTYDGGNHHNHVHVGARPA